MNKRYLGLSLIAIAFIIAKFSPFDGLSTANIALMMGLGAAAWIGVNMLMGTILPNPAGPNFTTYWA